MQPWSTPVLLDPHAPHRYQKPPPAWLSRLKEAGVFWAAAYGRAENTAKVALLQEGVKAFLMQHPENAGVSNSAFETEEIGRADSWVLLKLASVEQARLIAGQRVILHRQLNTALFYFPVASFFTPVQSIFVPLKSAPALQTRLNSSRADTISLLRRDISRYLQVPIERVEEASFFTRRRDADYKLGFRVYLADPAKCEDLDNLDDGSLDKLLEWRDLWDKSTTVAIPGDLGIRLHLLAPCGWCHSGDHGEASCPWRSYTPFGRQLVVVTGERDQIRPEDSVSGQASAASSAIGAR